MADAKIAEACYVTRLKSPVDTGETRSKPTVIT